VRFFRQLIRSTRELPVPAGVGNMPFLEEKTMVRAAKWHLLVASQSATLYHFSGLNRSTAVMPTIVAYCHDYIFTPTESSYK